MQWEFGTKTYKPKLPLPFVHHTRLLYISEASSFLFFVILTFELRLLLFVANPTTNHHLSSLPRAAKGQIRDFTPTLVVVSKIRDGTVNSRVIIIWRLMFFVRRRNTISIVNSTPLILLNSQCTTTLLQPHYKCVRPIRCRMIATLEDCIGNVARPETAVPQSSPNSEKERAYVGSRDSATDIEKTYRKGALSESDLIEA